MEPGASEARPMLLRKSSSKLATFVDEPYNYETFRSYIPPARTRWEKDGLYPSPPSEKVPLSGSSSFIVEYAGVPPPNKTFVTLFE